MKAKNLVVATMLSVLAVLSGTSAFAQFYDPATEFYPMYSTSEKKVQKQQRIKLHRNRKSECAGTNGNQSDSLPAPIQPVQS